MVYEKPNWSLYYNDTGAVVREGICDIIEARGFHATTMAPLEHEQYIQHKSLLAFTEIATSDVITCAYIVCMDCQHATSSRILILSRSVE